MSKPAFPTDLEIPPRKWNLNPASIERVTRRRGGDDAATASDARIHSYTEWAEELDWIDSERAKLGLSDAQCIALRERFRQRNQEIWGAHSWTPE